MGLVTSTLGAALLGVLALAPGESAVPELRSPAAEAVALTWEAPARCPDAAAVRQSLATYLGEGPTAEAGAGVRAVATVIEDGGRLRLSLRTETTSGVTTRETVADDCAVLVDATALIVAIAVDPTTVLARGELGKAAEAEAVEAAAEAAAVETVEPPEDETVEEPVSDPVVTSEPIEAVEPSEDDASPRAEPLARFGMRVAGGIDGGTLPGIAGGVRLTGAAIGRGWRAELRGDYWLPRTATATDGIGGRIGLGVGGLRGCGVPAIARVGLELPLCAGFEAGILRGDPVGDRVANPATAREPWVAVDASAGLAWVPRRFIAVVLQAELVVPITRAGFVVGDVEVYRVDAVAGRGLLGLEVRLP